MATIEYLCKICRVVPFQIWPLEIFMVTFVMKIQNFCLYLPEELFNTATTGFQMKGLAIRNNLDDFIWSQLVIYFQSYDYFAKFSEILPAFQQKVMKGHF